MPPKPYDPNFTGPVLDPSMIGKQAPMSQSQPGLDPLTAAIAQALQSMLGQQTDPLAKGKNNAMTLAALRNDPVGDRNRAYMPGAVAGTPEAASNPFTNGFFKSSAAALTPGQLAQSQGGNAMNQWKDPFQFQGQAPAQAMPFADFGTPTQSVPYVPPGPRDNPFDEPGFDAPASPFAGLLKRMFGARR